MNKLFWKKLFDESNLLIIIPAIVVIATFVLFLIFGLSDPDTSGVNVTESLVVNQSIYEEFYLTNLSNNDYTVDNPYFVLNPYNISPLTGLLMFNTSESKEYKVVIKGKTIEADIVYNTESLISHLIPIYSLYPGMENTIEVYEKDNLDVYTLVHTELVETAELPSNIVLPSFIGTSFAHFGNDLMITMSNTSNMPVGYDFRGDVRWYLSTELSWGPDQLNNGNFLFGNRNLFSDYYFSTELLEIDYLGKVYTQFTIPNGYHHDFAEMPNGNLLVATNDFLGSIEDIVVEIDRTTGEIVKTINIDDYLNILDGTSEMWNLVDWFHLNSVTYDSSTDSLILSGKNQDIVISINYETNELNWVIGDPENWDSAFVDEYFFTPVGVDFEWQYAQSDVEILSNGDIIIFDNGINKSKLREFDVSPSVTYSRAVVYRIDTDLMTISQVSEYRKALGNSFYSPEYSNVDVYSLNEFLIHSGENTLINGELNLFPNYEIVDGDVVEKLSTTVEVKDGVEVYRMEIKDSIYQTLRVSIYENTVNYSPTVGTILGSQLETEEYTGKINTKMNLLDNVPSKYNINFEKEFDRLIFNGTFSQGDIVFLILEGNHETRRYIVPTIESSFSSVCYDVCDDDYIDVTYFINEEGVSGKYNIKLIINGKEYYTYKNVIFE